MLANDSPGAWLKLVQQAPSVESYAARFLLAMGWSPIVCFPEMPSVSAPERLDIIRIPADVVTVRQLNAQL
jgi:hypothetical protein